MSKTQDKENVVETLLRAYTGLVVTTARRIASGEDAGTPLLKVIDGLTEHEAKAMLNARIVSDAVRKVEQAQERSEFDVLGDNPILN